MTDLASCSVDELPLMYAMALFDAPPGQTRLMELLCWQALLRGDIAHLQLFQQPSHLQPASLIALAIFRGNFSLASEISEVFVKALKVQTSKRKIFLPAKKPGSVL